MATIVIIDAADTASCPDDVTALQDNVMEDANRDGTLKLVSKVGVSIPHKSFVNEKKNHEW